jgi:hypothetical protein
MPTIVYDSDEDVKPFSNLHAQGPALARGPRRRMYVPCRASSKYPISHLFCRSGPTDPLAHHGRHFGRTVFSMCNVQSLITKGLIRSHEMADDLDSYTVELVHPSLYACWLPDANPSTFKKCLGKIGNTGSTKFSFRLSQASRNVWRTVGRRRFDSPANRCGPS